MITQVLRWLGGAAERRVTLENPSTSLYDALTTGLRTNSGVTVNETTAIRLGAVYACVRARAETLASMPLRVVRREDGEVLPEPEHPLNEILRWRANPTMTAYSAIELVDASTQLTGNGYGMILRGLGGIIGHQVLKPSICEPKFVGGEKVLIVHLEDGPEELGPTDFYHVPHMVLGGQLVGSSPIRIAAQSVGIALASAASVEAYYGNGTRSSAVVAHPDVLDRKKRKRLQEKLNDAIYANDKPGPDRRFGLVLLDEGMKYEEVGIPATDALILDAMQAADKDIARIFRMPPHKIGIMDQATFSNIEHQSIEWLQDSILPGATSSSRSSRGRSSRLESAAKASRSPSTRAPSSAATWRPGPRSSQAVVSGAGSRPTNRASG